MDLLINNNGGFSLLKSHKEKRIDTTNSTCDAIKYITNTYDQKQVGAWSITGDKIILVFEFSQDGIASYAFWEYPLKKLNDNEFWIIDNSEPWHKMYMDLRKL